MVLRYEIVRVVNARFLIDSESYLRAFEPDQIGLLAPSFYVVFWPGEADYACFDSRAEYFGPFSTRRSAEEAHEKMMSILEPSGALAADAVRSRSHPAASTRPAAQAT